MVVREWILQYVLTLGNRIKGETNKCPTKRIKQKKGRKNPKWEKKEF